MSLLSPFIDSKVGRRMVGLFALCALAPMLVLAIISYIQVSTQLRTASRERQHQTGKNVGNDVIARLRGLEAELALADATLAAFPGTRASLPANIAARVDARFKSLTVEDPAGARAALWGEPGPAATFSAPELAHLAAGRSLLRIEGPGRLFLVRSFSDSGRRLEAELDPVFLWSESELGPAALQVAVLAPSGGVVLFSTRGEQFTPPPDLAAALRTSAQGELEWTSGGSRELGSYWTVPLGFDFLIAHLVVLVSEERATVFAPIVGARTTFLLVTVLSLLVVLLLSLTQVRRSLGPLQLLTRGAQSVGNGDFEASVVVSSGDEFEALATAFNAMTGRVRRQFLALSSRAALDRAMLSSLDADTIMIAALERLPESVTGSYACLVTFGKRRDDPVRAFISGGSEGAPRKVHAPARVLPGEQALLLSHGAAFVSVDRDGDLPAFLEPLVHTPWRRGVAFPIIIEGWLAGVLTVASADAAALSPDELTQLRQVTDQVAVALANAGLVQALDLLNVGTLKALARTVDAKSPWTMGHSQRVTRMATDIGRELGLPHESLDLITRGALLHDIGKIAVPSAILDKPQRLTEAEYAVMKEHPRTGALILEPIPEYHRLIPIVLQHHEWFDGRGYPDGLSGDDISLEARVVAVADVFDAISSKRPYRDAMKLDRAVAIIEEGMHTQFDPQVVRAFLTMMARGYGSVTAAVPGGLSQVEAIAWMAPAVALPDPFIARD